MIWSAVCAGLDRFHAVLSRPDSLVFYVSDSEGRFDLSRPVVVVPMTTALRSVRLAESDGHRLVVGKAQDSGDFVLANDAGLVVRFDGTHGEQCVGVEALAAGLFRVGVVRSPQWWERYLVDGLTLAVTLDGSFPNPQGWADGWVDFRDGMPSWVPEHKGGVVGGVHFPCGPYEVCQSDVKFGCDVVRKDTGELQRVCDSDSPVPPQAAAMDDRIVVAMSADAPQLVSSADFGPMPAAVVGPIRVPDFPACQHVMAMSFTDDPEAPDWSEFCTLGRDDLHAAIARAKSRNVPVVGYWDHHEFDVATVATGAAIAKAAGVRFVPQAMFYPKPDESVETFRARIEPTAREIQRRWPDDWAAYGAAYRQWNGTSYPLGLQQVLDCQRVTYDVCRQFKARVLTWFAWRRPWQGPSQVVDGVLMFPELQESARRLKAAVSTRHQFPKQHAASAPQNTVPMPTTPPAHAQIDVPSYAEYVFDESLKFAAAFQERHGRGPTAGEQWTFAWRRYSEGWSYNDVMAEIQGRGNGPAVFRAPLPWHPTYAQFIAWSQQVWDAYKANHPTHDDPAITDMSHNGYRILAERYSFSALMAGLGGAAPAVVQGASAFSGSKPDRMSGDALLDVKGNFCNLRDSRNRIVYTPGLTGAPADVYDEWMRIQREGGSTHVFFGPPIGGAAYPGMSWANPDFWSDLPAFRAFVEKVLDTPAADGNGFRPVIFVGGDTFDQSRFEGWPELAAALDGLHEFLILVPGWECIPQEGWTSNQYAKALRELKRLFPSSKIAAHMQPTRWAFSSNPVESDDPWQGGESECYKSHGGEHVDLVLYQTQHGRDLYRPCTCPDSPKGQFTHREECWLNRFEDGVARLGDGYHGWRKVAIALYESVAYEAYRGQATPDQARDIATAAKKVADKWGVELGYGNGVP